jgi:hypothetical protein
MMVFNNNIHTYIYIYIFERQYAYDLNAAEWDFCFSDSCNRLNFSRMDLRHAYVSYLDLRDYSIPVVQLFNTHQI